MVSESKDAGLSAYMESIRRVRLLAGEEERALATSYRRTGDRRILQKIVAANLRLVVKIAGEFRKNWGELADLIQEGNVGLIKAVERFDPDRGFRLSTYAAWWIRAYITRFLVGNWRQVKLGTTQAQRHIFFKLRQELERYERDGREPDDGEMAARLGVPEAELASMRDRMGHRDASLETGQEQRDGGRSWLDTLAADEAQRPDRQIEGGELRALVGRTLADFRLSLNARDRVVLDERWLSEDPVTLRELGARFGVSRERVRQIELGLLRRFKRRLQRVLRGAILEGSAARGHRLGRRSMRPTRLRRLTAAARQTEALEAA